MVRDFGRTAPRRRAGVTINADLLCQSKQLGIPLSAALEHRLAKLIHERRREAWLAENREAIAAANDYLERHGLPLAEHRLF